MLSLLTETLLVVFGAHFEISEPVSSDHVIWDLKGTMGDQTVPIMTYQFCELYSFLKAGCDPGFVSTAFTT